jgi:hypothetical protein
VGPPQVLSTRPTKRLYAMEFFADAKGGLVAWAESTTEVQALQVSPSGEKLGEARSIKLAGARRLMEIRRWDDQHYVIFTHGVCDPAIRDHKCLVAQLVDERGTPVGSSIRTDTNEWMTIDSAEQVGQRHYILYHTTYQRPQLVVIERDAQGKMSFSDKATAGYGECLDIPAPAGLGEMFNMKLVADQDGWYVLRPPLDFDDAPPAVPSKRQPGALCTASKQYPIKDLPENMELAGWKKHDEALVALFVPRSEDNQSEAAAAKSRPSLLVRLDKKGKLLGPPTKVKPGQPLPPPFDGGGALSYSLSGPNEQRGACMLLRKGSGDYAPTNVATLSPGFNDGPYAAAEWVSNHFLVATASFENKAWQLVMRSALCAP